MKWLWIICPPVHHWQLQPRFVFLNKTSFYLRGLGSASISEECPGRLKCVYGQNTRRGQHAEHEEDGAGVRYAASCSCSGLLARPPGPPSLLSALCPGGRHISIGGGRDSGRESEGGPKPKPRRAGRQWEMREARALARSILIFPFSRLRPSSFRMHLRHRERGRQVVPPMQTMTNYE